MSFTFSPAILALADGTIFQGYSVGYQGETVGEVVFNTSMTGYQEIITDPSYTQQIVTLSYPHIGNVGCNSEDNEADTIWASGLIVRDVPVLWSNWRGKESLSDFLIRKKMVAIAGIDTRQLIHHLREKGAQMGCISAISASDAAIAKARACPGMEGADLASLVSTRESYSIEPSVGANNIRPYQFMAKKGEYYSPLQLEREHSSPSIVVYDFGVKQNILKILVDLGCDVTVVPARTLAEAVLKQNPDGIVLSNGPGDPKACDYAIAAIQTLLKNDIPLMGICLGFQLLALAAGARTFKMKLGHHGANHPVSCVEEENKVIITSQNHGFAVDEKSLPEYFKITHRSLFDQSLQGFKHRYKPFFGFQGHPEASPGPQDAHEFFGEFLASFCRNKYL